MENEKRTPSIPNEVSLNILPIIVRALKCHATEEQPLSRDKLLVIANIYASEYIKKDSFDNYIESITAILNGTDDDILLNARMKKYAFDFDVSEREYEYDRFKETIANLRKTFIFSFGGIIKRSEKKGFINPSHYYFEPLLNHSEVNMLEGIIISNPYITNEEKKYLVSRMKALTTYDDLFLDYEHQAAHNKKTERNTERKIEKELELLYFKNTKTNEEQKKADEISFYHLENSNKKILNNIKVINDAITNGFKIEVEYGIYSIDKRTKRPALTKKRETPYILDPYALCWDRGFYYLICKNPEHDMPSHFRVDRIMNVKLKKAESYNQSKDHSKNHSKKTQSAVYLKRDPIPKELKPFFDETTGEFKSIEYRRQHPLMSINEKNHLINCVFETGALSILVDYFGEKNIRLSPVENRLDDQGRQIYQASINNIEFKSACLFAIQKHSVIKVISPAELADATTKELTTSLTTSST